MSLKFTNDRRRLYKIKPNNSPLDRLMFRQSAMTTFKIVWTKLRMGWIWSSETLVSLLNDSLLSLHRVHLHNLAWAFLYLSCLWLFSWLSWWVTSFTGNSIFSNFQNHFCNFCFVLLFVRWCWTKFWLLPLDGCVMYPTRWATSSNVFLWFLYYLQG